jgi:hypothetical protein
LGTDGLDLYQKPDSVGKGESQEDSAMKPLRPTVCPEIFVALDENRFPPVLTIKAITCPRRSELLRDWAA